jgi:hypothetical protein
VAKTGAMVIGTGAAVAGTGRAVTIGTAVLGAKVNGGGVGSDRPAKLGA